MKLSFYQKHTDEWFRGRRARTLQPIESYRQNIEAGREVIIKRKYKGFTIHTKPCAQCGVGLEITRVPPHKLELIEEG